jgi:hypothetical protein
VATNLTWEAVPTADRYLVQVARDAGFTRTVAMRSVTGATAVPLANLETSTTYYWRVQAIAGVRTSPWSTVWSFTTVAPKPVAGQPDLLVRPYAGGPYFGWCNYSSGQTLTLETRVDVPATFRLAVRNTARKTDDFIIAGPASDGDWQVQYRDAAGTDITSQVTGPGWRVPCTVGEIKEFTAIVSPGPNAASYTRHTITVLAVSGTNELLRDAVSLTSVCTPR